MCRRILLAALALVSLLVQMAAAQDRGSKAGRIDVDNYAIDAEINPRTQTLSANVKVRFTALDSDISTASFELNSAFNVSRVADDSGRQISASRSGQDFSLPPRLSSSADAAIDFAILFVSAPIIHSHWFRLCSRPSNSGRGGGIRTPKSGFGDRQFNR